MKRLSLFALFLVLYEFTTYASNDMIMPGMLKVVTDFNAPVSYVASSLSFYLLGNTLLQLFLGPLAERYGKRRIIVIGNWLFLIFTIFIAVSTNIFQFMLGRVLQGSGMAFIAMGYALIHEKFDDRNAVKIIALMANVSLLAPLFGPLIGATIIAASSWQYIFIVTGMMGLISLIGLYRYTPFSIATTQEIDLKKIFSNYKQIFTNRNFWLGSVACSIAPVPLLAWIGLSPTMIMHAEGLSFSKYIIYQLIAIGGLTISSILMQFIAGKISFYKLISRGCWLSLSGLVVGFIFNHHITIVVLGLSIYSLGLGIFNGAIMRVVMHYPGYAKSYLSSSMVFLQTLILAIGVEISNEICSKFSFSVASFSIVCLGVGIITFILVSFFTKTIINKQWE